MIFVYIGAIIAFIGIGVAFFVSAKKKEQKRLRKLSEENIVNLKATELPESLVKENVAEENLAINTAQKTTENKEVLTGELENFSLDIDDKPADNSNQSEDEEEDEIDKRFAEYQKFLRENLDMDDEEEAIGPEIAQQYDDYETTDFTDKSPEEIAQMMKNMPPKMKEILFSDALGRKEFDDENNQSETSESNSN